MGISSSKIEDGTAVVKSQLSSSPVVVYSKTDCYYCSKAKRLLQEQQIKYVAVELNKMDMLEMQNLWMGVQKFTHQRTVPQIFICGKHIGGYTDLETLHANGALMSAIEECSAKFS